MRTYAVLPPMYKQVEYIQSSGTQYINTGVIPADDVEWTADIALTSSALSNNRNYVVGISGGSFRHQFSYSASAYYGWGASGSSGTLTVDTNRHSVKVSKDAFIIDSTTVYTPTSHMFAETERTVYMFARDNANTGAGADLANGLRIYGATAKKSGALIRNYIPCVRGSDSKAGMYDTVTHRFFASAGTGNFLIPD